MQWHRQMIQSHTEGVDAEVFHRGGPGPHAQGLAGHAHKQ